MTPEHYSMCIKSSGRVIVSCEDFIAPQDKITFLFGESGIGKSLLCKALYGLLDGDELDVTINGRPYKDHCSEILTKNIFNNSFFVFQEPSSHLNPLKRIGEQLCEGSLEGAEAARPAIMRRLWQNADDAAIQKIIDMYPKPFRPSGGEKQRVLLAMAFEKMELFVRAAKTSNPSLFVFDEPTGSLDNNYRNLFIRFLFEKYEQRPFSIMFITHDYSIISEIYAHYKHLLPEIFFRELSRRHDSTVDLHDFSAKEYLSWLDTAAPPKDKASPDTAEVLRIEPEFKIFNRTHFICTDPERSRQGPLVIRKGEIAYVKAASGVGKTTLAKIIMGLYPAQKFSMSLCGMTVNHCSPGTMWSRRIWGKKAGMVFQHADESLDLESNIGETFKGLPFKRGPGDRDIVGLLSPLFDPQSLTDNFLKRKVSFLSGGQKQRLNLLRTLSLDTDLIILDEPLNGLDFKGVTRVLDLLEEKRKNGSAFLLISHNEEIFDSIVDPRHRYYLT
jgi:peptide/nickel transport system ATP-binding protein